MKLESLDSVLKQQLDDAGEEGQVDALVVIGAEFDEDGTEHVITKIRREVEQD